jgi:hypothetical protein
MRVNNHCTTAESNTINMAHMIKNSSAGTALQLLTTGYISYSRATREAQHVVNNDQPAKTITGDETAVGWTDQCRSLSRLGLTYCSPETRSRYRQPQELGNKSKSMDLIRDIVRGQSLCHPHTSQSYEANEQLQPSTVYTLSSSTRVPHCTHPAKTQLPATLA